MAIINNEIEAKYPVLWVESGQSSLSPQIANHLKIRNYPIEKREVNLEDLVRCFDEPFVHFVLSDNEKMPTVLALRQILAHPLAVLSPITAHCETQHHYLEPLFTSMPNVAFVQKPCTNITFINTFTAQRENCKKSPTHLLMQQVRHHITLNNHKTAIQTLVSAVGTGEKPDVSSTICLSLILRQLGEYQAAEQFLLAKFHFHPTNCPLILSLVQLYLELASPSTALGIIQSAIKHSADQTIYLLDLCQVHFMLNNLDECVNILREFSEKAIAPTLIRKIMPRMLYASGQHKHFDQMMGYHKDYIDVYHTAWRK